MKNFAHALYITVFALIAISCETTELNLVEDPNTIRPEEANPQFLLNTMQLDYKRFIEDSQDVNARLSRINAMFMYNDQDGSYEDFFIFERNSTELEDNDLSAAWINFYLNIIPNFNLLQTNARATNSNIYNFNIAVANIIKAHCASILVDQYADIPFSQAGQLLEFPNPELEKGAMVYEKCIALLDEAIDLLKEEPLNSTIDDIFYDGDSQSWLRLANSLKLRMYKNTGNTNAFNAIIASGDYISSTEHDMEFQYISGVRSPEITGDYPSTGGNLPIPKSNWLMGTMYDLNDPRLPYYFYRQTNETPGIDINANPVLLPCSDDPIPSHYAGHYYCAAPAGYIGRSHGSNYDISGNDRPDRSIAALYGVYPHGGMFDDGRFMTASIANFPDVQGAVGFGKLLILTAFEVDFWRGQMANSVGEKAVFLRSAMEKQIAKVRTFGELDSTADLSTAPSASDFQDYVDNVITSYTNATSPEQENIFAEQYLIAHFGHGLESYNFYKKTGYPTSLSPSWNPNPGPFPRSFPYPDQELYNSSTPLENKALTDQVFWDTNPAFPTFPIAN